jgi:nitrite reductase/ring-hydroxylating ferredoxin subunit
MTTPTMTAMSSEPWVRVAATPPAPGTVVDCDDHDVVVWRTSSGEICVMDSRCPHQWSHLGAEGVVDGDELVCTSHFWRFTTSGEGSKLNVAGRRDPKAPIRVFEHCNHNGEIWARIDR